MGKEIVLIHNKKLRFARRASASSWNDDEDVSSPLFHLFRYQLYNNGSQRLLNMKHTPVCTGIGEVYSSERTLPTHVELIWDSS